MASIPTWAEVRAIEAERDAALQEVERLTLLLGAKASEIEAIWIEHQAELEAEVASLRAALASARESRDSAAEACSTYNNENVRLRAALREAGGPEYEQVGWEWRIGPMPWCAYVGEVAPGSHMVNRLDRGSPASTVEWRPVFAEATREAGQPTPEPRACWRCGSTEMFEEYDEWVCKRCDAVNGPVLQEER